ncbi:putative translation initiation factor SUI1 [Gregarina niphandrodes]|uniref:Translation initiation factor SUI1 n=1 Tax=Gregarina niphandrodes TaxID=110365 RepID=A0A023B8Z4_GRENI|nr:putative translation initiation factor SUI1 [Gregarina niphandrodes]EZG70700.1 putative translation initiation factor SUI1 [Gregarina niphandrodes]|eukprot:XP_011129883.1 putative translation initiation factor SUI1 [Gregarina niphandrodes]
MEESRNNGEVASQYIVHIRVQQRNGRKSLTTVQGLDPRFDAKKIVRAMQKRFNCNGTVVVDSELGPILQLQGDQRQNVQEFLLGEYIVTENELRIHGA